MKRLLDRTQCLLAGLLFTAAIPIAAADDVQGIEALLKGKPHVRVRYRFENVDDDLVPTNDANASTMRAVLGWESGTWNGFSLYGEFEHVTDIGDDDYKEGPGPIDPSKAGLYPVVADPPGTEVNQAYVRYTGPMGLDTKFGRQDLTYRKAPFHRFIGNVLWRQNRQTYDALSIRFDPIEQLTLSYGYVDKVHRIFGDDAPGPFDELECDCHLVNAQYDAFEHVKLEAYSYLLDIENAALNSTDTFGIRASGAYLLADNWKVIYAGEFATQSDASGNPRNVDADYYLGELGVAVEFNNPIVRNLTVKLDYEVLEGDGTGSFITPLATGHAFQGWADRFLATPPDGIEDVYVTAVASVLGGKLIASYHMLESDNLGYDYGDEFDILYARKFQPFSAGSFTAGVKAAVYSADRNAVALRRAGGPQNNDVTKLWVWAQFDF